MGARSKENSEVSEQTPLLADAEGQQDNRLKAKRSKTLRAPLQKAAIWTADNAASSCILVLILIFVTVACVYFGAPKKIMASVCLTPACIHASSEILYNLDANYKTIDPCTNFEQMVCGGWDDRHDLRPDQGGAFTGTIMSENSQMLLRHILEAPYPNTSAHSAFSPRQLYVTLASVDEQNFDKLKDGYNACMNEDTIKTTGIKPLLEILHQVADFFPVQGSAFATKTTPAATEGKDLAEVVLYLSKLGVTALVGSGAGADDKDPDTVTVQVGPPGRIGLPAKDYYKDEAVVKKYEATLSTILKNLDPEHNTENATARAHDVVEFEKKLASFSPDAAESNDVTQYYNPMSIKDADSLAPQLHLATIINGLAPASYKTERLIVTSPSYMRNLSDVLSNTSKEALQTYFVWKVVQSYSTAVEAEEVKPYAEFSNVLQGKDPKSQVDRWRTCVNHVDSGLGWILSRFFVEKAFSEKAKNFGDQIVSDIKETFIGKLKKTTWMDESVVKLAIEKVHKIVQKIGYPTESPNIMDPPSLQNYYQSVNIAPTNFFQNILNMNRFTIAKEWSTLGKPVDRNTWGMTVPTVNAYYNPPGNEIVFPAGIMQFPVFDVDVPQFLSYGAFGSVSGHELSHAFDSTGRHYDQNGNYTDWWTNSTVEGFKKRADCFVGQYAEYTVPGPDNNPLHVNGKLTLGENIADAGGVTAAFAAWQKRRAATPNQDLPGLEYFSQEQLFFVSYANWWCGKDRKETAINRIYTDPHAPKWARILGTMANSRDFKESFKCAKTEPVCELW